MISPYFVEQLFARNHAVCRGGQVLEQLEFLGGKSDGPSSTLRFHASEVDARITKGKNLVMNSLGRDLGHHRRCVPGAPHRAAYPSQEFLGTERLRHVIIGAQLEQQNFVIDFGICA